MVKIYADRNDWRIGLYRGPHHWYLCPLPALVIRWPRRNVPAEPPADLFDAESELATEREAVFMRLADLQDRVEGLEFREHTVPPGQLALWGKP